MSNYDFSTLNPADFERLVCDLLNVKIDANTGAMYRTSKEGKDKGIDLLFSTADKDFEIVVQTKHYFRSTYSKLKSDLIKNEKQKVLKLKPSHYIFATSLPLSVQNKLEIKEIFAPYITSLEDILGCDDLNDILRLNKTVEERHFKLWFSGTTALQRFINYKFIARNEEFSELEVKKKLRLYVGTHELTKAEFILEHNKFLIVTGEPGVGKTTLSEILICKYLSKDYELTVIYDDIRDIESTLRIDNSKQIFYFDDFLGHTQMQISKSKTAEATLLRLIKRLEKLENKYLILNTRKFILNTFLAESERLEYLNPLRGEAKIELTSYSYGAKRRMLDNHIFESTLNDNLLSVLKDLAFQICSHVNFSPRHLEFFTSNLLVGHFSPKELHQFILENLANPKKIWQHAYLEQINDYDRFMLSTIYSFNGEESNEVIESAFNSRLSFEVKNNNFSKPINAYIESLRNLNDGFIITVNSRRLTNIKLINPSLEDFLHFYITNNPLEIERILYSSNNYKQWYCFYEPFNSNKLFDRKLLDDFVDKFIKNDTFIRSDEERFYIVIFVFYHSNQIYDDELITILKSIESWDFLRYNFPKHLTFAFLQNAKENSKLNELIAGLSFDIYIFTILSCQFLEEIIDIVQLFKKHYAFDFKIVLSNPDNSLKYREEFDNIFSVCVDLFQEQIDSNYKILNKNIDDDFHIDVIDRLDDFHEFIKEYLFETFDVDYSIITDKDWNEIAKVNHISYLSLDEKSKTEYYDEHGNEYFDEYEYDEYDDYYDFEQEKLKSIPSQQIIFKDNFEDDFPF